MKKYKEIIAAGVMCLIMGYSYGQYGSLGYSHNNSFLTSAKKTNISSTGFIMAGVFPTSSAGQEDFLIQKTDANGNLTSGFTRYFNITSDPTCTNATPYSSHKCLGVDVVETSITGTMRYAVAGLFDAGIFFATLDVNGNVIQKYYWPTGLGAQRFMPTVRESQSTPGVFYICGNSASKGYAIKINTSGSGTVVWSKWYTNLFLEPRGIIESPYISNEVIIVGRCDVQSPGNSAEAFFLRVDGMGVPINFKCYSDGLTGDEWFNSIELANSPTGGSGFILGGQVRSSNPALNSYTPWMIKLSPTGNVIWSTIIRHTEQIADVIERYNTVAVPPKYEYFGISRANPYATAVNTMRVWKLNDVGAAAATPNVFIYGIGSTNPINYDYTYAQIEAVGNGPTLGDGFAAFGTQVSANRHILIKSYYNGINGCDLSTNMATTNGPGISSTQVLNYAGFVPVCAYFNLNPVQSIGSYTSTCSFGWTTFPGTGSNAKEGLATGLDFISEDMAGLVSVYPNPTKGVFAVEMNTNPGPVKINLSNSLGQIVKYIELPEDPSSTQKALIDFNDLELSEGLYFLNINIQGQNLTKKVIYTK